MPKQKSSMKPREKQENPVAEQEKPSSASKKPSNEIGEIFHGKKRKKPPSASKKPSDEIDDIFAEKKRKNPEKEKSKRPKDESVKPKSINKKKNSKGIGFADKPSGPKKVTADGLVIYAEEELGINKADAGGTPLCPFDCSCCF